MTRVNAKHVVFGLIGMMSAYVLYHNERFLVEPTNPQTKSAVPPPVTQEKPPDKDFTHSPEKLHDPTAFFFNF